MDMKGDKGACDCDNVQDQGNDLLCVECSGDTGEPGVSGDNGEIGERGRNGTSGLAGPKGDLGPKVSCDKHVSS